MGTADIEVAINSIPAKKDDLRKAFEVLQSYSSSFASFTLQWKDIEEHFSSIEKSIEEKFRELKAKDVASSAPEKPRAAPLEANSKEVGSKVEVEPRADLKSLCIKMDGKGLRSFIIQNRKDIQAIRKELGAALRSAPDPVKLALSSLEGFQPSKGVPEGELQAIRRTCLTILESLHGFAPEIMALAKDNARNMAVEWKGLIVDGKGENSLVVMAFLQLVVTFGLVEFFAVDEILDFVVLVARRKSVVDLCRNSALEGKMPELLRSAGINLSRQGSVWLSRTKTNLVDKLNNDGKHLDAVRFVLAFNLQHKFPPASLLKAYIKESKKAAQVVRQKGKNSVQSKNEATSKEITALKTVVKFVEEYNLGSVYPCENLQNRIEQLEKQKAEKKRGATAIAASNSNVKGQKHHHQQPNKRPRPTIPAATVLPVHPHSQNQPHLGLLDRASHLGLTASSLHSFGGAILSGNHVGLGGPHAPPKSYLHPSESLTGSVYYDRPVTYGGYPTSSVPARYNPLLYP